MNKLVRERFDEYSKNARIKLEGLRNLVFQVVYELKLDEVGEILK
ncbi:hypothetical protein [Sessilibacter sp. MAH4]